MLKNLIIKNVVWISGERGQEAGGAKRWRATLRDKLILIYFINHERGWELGGASSQNCKRKKNFRIQKKRIKNQYEI